MKLVVLAGGRGARLGALSNGRPKPMLPVLGRPILHRVIDHAALHGLRDVVVALGYRADVVRAYFDQAPDVEHLTEEHEVVRPPVPRDRVRVRTVDTGASASKVDRLTAVAPLIGDEPFLLTYCDALSDIDLTAMVRMHRTSGARLTLAAVHGRERFGVLDLDGTRVGRLREKPIDDDRWINGGVFVVEPDVLATVDTPQMDWETGPVQRLISAGEAFAYRHHGWWECVDRPEDLAFVERACELAGDEARAEMAS